ncbi:SGNH/GDSL hydrolase family protein [Variovorax robiniae]|uniref:SGNH/GDSL hydrolase family protein n=1 Tax=Variovorax robiniae TaxID=1836199 RepID=A0ABU8X8G3_9BURK
MTLQMLDALPTPARPVSRLTATARLRSLALCASMLATLAAWAPEAARAQDFPPPPPAAGALSAAETRWHAALAAFAQADKEAPPAPDGIVFVGSSTIRMWKHLAADFPAQPNVLNRGFGGSTLSDCSLLARELVLRYKPRQVVVYAGDNDLAEGQTPLQVLTSYVRLSAAVRAELPNARISFISVKPSPSRAALLPQIRETNDIVAAYLRTQANSDFIDIYTPMLGSDGRPRTELFLPDMLHMTDAGYRIWQSAVAPHLLPPETIGARH